MIVFVVIMYKSLRNVVNVVIVVTVQIVNFV